MEIVEGGSRAWRRRVGGVNHLGLLDANANLPTEPTELNLTSIEGHECWSRARDLVHLVEPTLISQDD